MHIKHKNSANTHATGQVVAISSLGFKIIMQVFIAVFVVIGCLHRQKPYAPFSQSHKVHPIAPEAEVSQKFMKTQPCLWKEAEAEVTLGQHDTPYQAKGRAITIARKKAIEEVVGYEIRSREVVFELESLAGHQALVENLITSMQSALILDEEVVEAKIVPLTEGEAKYQLRIKACVASLPDRVDKGFRIMLDMNKQNFVKGDDAVATITVTRSACVYLLNVDLEGNWTLLFPNPHARENCTTPDRPIIYPDARLQKMGIHMRAELPPGKRLSTEVLRVLAFKEKMDHLFTDTSARPTADDESEIHHSSYQINSGKFGELIRRVLMEDVEWVEDSFPFVIYEK